MLSARNWEKTSPDDSPCGPLTRASKEITLRVSAFTMGWNAKLNSKSTPPKFGRLAAGFLLRWFGVTVFAFGAEDLSHESPDDPLPDRIVSGDEPLIVLGAIAGG